MNLALLEGTFIVCRLAPDDALPPRFFSATRTAEELSLVCLEQDAPQHARQESGWSCLRVAGPLDFALTGILASLAVPLAEAGVSIFAISTFDTDYLLVKTASLATALDALRAAGFTEPASAASVAGLLRSVRGEETAFPLNSLPEDARIVCVLTGHGLKDPEIAQRDLPPIRAVRAEKGEILRAMD